MTQRVSVRYNVQLIAEDMASRGLQPVDVARQAELSPATISRFFDGRHQTARTAARIAKILKRPIARYIVREAQAAVA